MNEEKVKRINQLFDEVIIDAADLVKDLLSSVEEIKYSAIFWFMVSAFFLWAYTFRSPDPPSGVADFIFRSLSVIGPFVIGLSRVWRYFQLKKKYQKFNEVLDEFGKF